MIDDLAAQLAALIKKNRYTTKVGTTSIEAVSQASPRNKASFPRFLSQPSHTSTRKSV